ncbi:MAG TPA: FcoT family thioesterase [Pseudonocardiaceae bacterium]|nr:FcoT family thioesterase [Pseudonocardiaceae bacterium]
MTAATIEQPLSYPVDEELLARVLRAYKPNCRYLTDMTIDDEDGQVRGFAEFAIGESCYIEDTGHLNAVEVNIAYNQMLYYLIATSVRERLIPVFADWTMAEFWRRQLPDILITKLTTRFRGPIDRSRFFGQFDLRYATQRKLTRTGPALIALDTGFRFWDGRGGRADGEATIAVSES